MPSPEFDDKDDVTKNPYEIENPEGYVTEIADDAYVQFHNDQICIFFYQDRYVPDYHKDYHGNSKKIYYPKRRILYEIRFGKPTGHGLVSKIQEVLDQAAERKYEEIDRKYFSEKSEAIATLIPEFADKISQLPVEKQQTIVEMALRAINPQMIDAIFDEVTNPERKSKK